MAEIWQFLSVYLGSKTRTFGLRGRRRLL